jgi:hypothetical protein
VTSRTFSRRSFWTSSSLCHSRVSSACRSAVRRLSSSRRRSRSSGDVGGRSRRLRRDHRRDLVDQHAGQRRRVVEVDQARHRRVDLVAPLALDPAPQLVQLGAGVDRLRVRVAELLRQHPGPLAQAVALALHRRELLLQRLLLRERRRRADRLRGLQLRGLEQRPQHVAVVDLPQRPPRLLRRRLLRSLLLHHRRRPQRDHRHRHGQRGLGPRLARHDDALTNHGREIPQRPRARERTSRAHSRTAAHRRAAAPPRLGDRREANARPALLTQRLDLREHRTQLASASRLIRAPHRQHARRHAAPGGPPPPAPRDRPAPAPRRLDAQQRVDAGVTQRQRSGVGSGPPHLDPRRGLQRRGEHEHRAAPAAASRRGPSDWPGTRRRPALRAANAPKLHMRAGSTRQAAFGCCP